MASSAHVASNKSITNTGTRHMHQNITAFLKVLDPADNTTGGGAASALAGAMAGALVAMVARLSMGREGMEAPPFYEQIAAEAESLSGLLLAGGEEDSRAFEAVRAAFRLPKGTGEERGACASPRFRRPGSTPPACRWPTPSAAAACSSWRPRSAAGRTPTPRRTCPAPSTWRAPACWAARRTSGSTCPRSRTQQVVAELTERLGALPQE